MIIRHSPAAPRHDPQGFFRYGRIVEHPESVERYHILLAAAANAGEVREAVDHGLAPIAAVHDPNYLELLRTGFARAPDKVEEVVPTQFAPWTPHRRPEGLAGQLGYHMTDTSTPLRAGTWDAVYGAAQAAISAADDIFIHSVAYALCRPPGHHASAAHAGGFCYLNNAAIAAERLRASMPRVAILDIDVHHGNGTQAIFYDRNDILFVSVHAETASYFPYFTGYADEIGVGAGEGFTQNLPLPLGSGDDAYCSALAIGIERILAFAPDALVVSLGFDAAAEDPIGAFTVSERGFVRAAEIIANAAMPTVLIQEGGYPSKALGQRLLRFLQHFDAMRPDA
ncbi:histone deacetylase family protein [Flavisphingomonas formosensis]|uniref:histone deacetylase family protein n=1 Tax=Flavisphingomonas formosensis TaxID=861534 RepID=UPI0012F95BE0|nr:histone deacetylase family protein [Sphingomonas formosensis]